MAVSKGSVPICVISPHVIALPISSVGLHPLPNQGGLCRCLVSAARGCAPLRTRTSSAPQPGLLPQAALRPARLAGFYRRELATSFDAPVLLSLPCKQHDLESGRRPITNNPARAGLFGCLPMLAAVASPSLARSSIMPGGNGRWSDADRRPAGSAPGRRGRCDRPQRRPRWRIR